MSLFWKDMSFVTGNLSKVITTNYSFNHSNSCHWGSKPGKKDHSQDKSCSYESLSLRPTANMQSRSFKTTKDFNLKSFRCTGSQLGDEDQKTITKKQKHQHKSNLKDNLASNKAYSIVYKPFVPYPDINRRAHLTFVSGSLQASSAPQPISTSIPTKKNFTGEEYSSNFDSKKINSKTIEKDKNPSTNTKTTISNIKIPLSINQPYTNSYKIYKKTNKIQSLLPVVLAPVPTKLSLQQ
ncbi:hypothetical protein O181_069988 [Austropuccinia psidii MF-1]|uniref:Uncharacterized protein n=1 Tax=Austropuccinia psidii MF-1 TaxID=1389203 RepID=A0A9Q3I6V2_9BASI|nr:hypothetical protein [Austropuccinia psidii MF-1]